MHVYLMYTYAYVFNVNKLIMMSALCAEFGKIRKTETTSNTFYAGTAK